MSKNNILNFNGLDVFDDYDESTKDISEIIFDDDSDAVLLTFAYAVEQNILENIVYHIKELYDNETNEEIKERLIQGLKYWEQGSETDTIYMTLPMDVYYNTIGVPYESKPNKIYNARRRFSFGNALYFN